MRVRPKLIKVRYHREEKTYTCGPAALKIAFSHFGKHFSENTLIRFAGGVGIEGANFEKMKKIAKKAGFRVVVARTGNRWKDLQKYIDRGLPVIVIFRCWGDGHYSVAVGYDKKYVYIMDPASDRLVRRVRVVYPTKDPREKISKYAYLKHPRSEDHARKTKIKEFIKRWWDNKFNTKKKVKGQEIYRRWMMVVKPK